MEARHSSAWYLVPTRKSLVRNQLRAILAGQYQYMRLRWRSMQVGLLRRRLRRSYMRRLVYRIPKQVLLKLSDNKKVRKDTVYHSVVYQWQTCIYYALRRRATGAADSPDAVDDPVSDLVNPLGATNLLRTALIIIKNQ